MALTEIEEKYIDERIANLATKAAENIIEKVITAHVNSCPHGKKLLKVIYISVGVGIGSGIIGGGASMAIIRLLLG